MKKIIAMILVIALTAAISVGATLAYLTDTDEDVNVMTVGNVRIEQNEQQRVEANGEFTSALEPFEQGKLLMPVTYPGNRTADTVKVGEHEIVLSDNEANYVDKIISVTNTGKSAAFVRTLVAVPTGGKDWEPTPVSANNCWLHWNIPNEYTAHWTLNAANTPMITVEGVNYYVWEFVHKEALAGGETTYPSVRGFYMDEKVNNDDDGFFMTYADGTTKRIVTADTVDVLVLSQAVQAAGFADAETALDTAFGKTSEKAVEWFADIAPEQPPVKPEGNWSEVADTSWIGDGSADTFEIRTAEELAGFAQLVNSGTAPGKYGKPFNEKTVILKADIDLAGMCWTPIGVANGNEFWGIFDGNGHTIKNLYVEGTANVGLFGGIFAGMDWTKVVATVKNVTVDGATIIAAENAGVIVGRTYGNVENCTVKNATISVSDGKAGAIVGTTASDSTMVSVSNNSAENVTITGTRATGAIAGRIWESCCAHKGNTWKNVTVNGAACDDEVGELY